MNAVKEATKFYEGLQNHILNSPHLSPLREYLPVTPAQLRDYNFCRNLHGTTMLKSFGNSNLSNLMLRAIDEYIRNDLRIPSLAKRFDPKVLESVQTMHAKGHADLSPLSLQKVKEMRDYFSAQKVYGADNKTLISLEEASERLNIANYPVETILASPHLMSIAADPEILSIVENYLGTVPTISVVATWWSFAGKEAPKDAQLFHYDYDDYRFCKLFLYLTDVDMDSGPHCYVESTHTLEKIKQVREKCANESELAEFDKSYMHSLRKTDADILKYFGSPIYLTGKAGSQFLVDTRGIHKGLLPTKNNRLLCQITYGVSPLLQDKPTSIRLGTPESKNIPASINESPYNYVARMFVEPDPAVEQKNSEVIILDNVDHWDSKTVDHFIGTIFKNEDTKKAISLMLQTRDDKITSYNELLTALRNLFRDNIEWAARDPNHKLIEYLRELSNYEQLVNRSLTAYNPKLKPNPGAVFWPNPTNDPKNSLFETLPIAVRHPIVSKETPIGSAGSCFAFEISYYLQERGFNYVVTEEGQNADKGILIEGFDPAVPYEKFCANWGILFNTPSFRQLAEKAFGKRKLPKILVKKHTPDPAGNDFTFYVDPFRENVFFLSPKAYEDNYQEHLEATRKALLETKVFILTLGLNECWEFIKDGSVVSRNPHTTVAYSLLRHRTLTVEENVANIQAFIDIVREHNPDFKVIISVSPIPFLATGRADEQHVITANGHSKAILRVAAEELVKKNKGVFYFPSFEMVGHCIQNPWEADQRHVTRPAVQRVMQLFETMFMKN
ncbi:MAG: hypothetical protein JWQ35_1151 [Bacteriovoracaceae bacterium]|nr:hypothetical protein [Bacteriovoracaceae bacterium]